MRAKDAGSVRTGGTGATEDAALAPFSAALQRYAWGMSEVVQAPESASESGREPTRISHWIGGRTVPGESGRSGPVYNPATGEQSGAVDLATAD